MTDIVFSGEFSVFETGAETSFLGWSAERVHKHLSQMRESDSMVLNACVDPLGELPDPVAQSGTYLNVRISTNDGGQYLKLACTLCSGETYVQLPTTLDKIQERLEDHGQH